MIIQKRAITAFFMKMNAARISSLIAFTFPDRLPKRGQSRAVSRMLDVFAGDGGRILARGGDTRIHFGGRQAGAEVAS